MKSFVISLDNEIGEQRRNVFFQHCDDAGIDRPEWVAGVDARERYDQGSVTALCRLTCSFGALGAGMAHKTIYKEQVGKQPYVMIFEDDAVLSNGFSRKLKAAMEQVPSNFDILLLGCQASCGSGTDGIYPVENVLGLHGYVISAKGMKKMNTTPLDDHIDIQMGKMAKEGKLDIYYCNPDIVDASTTDFKSSFISPPRSFPNSITTFFNQIYNEKALPHSRHFTSERRRIGPFGLNNYHMSLFIIGLILGHQPILYWLFALDVALFEALSAANTVTTIFAYVLGAYIHVILTGKNKIF